MANLKSLLRKAYGVFFYSSEEEAFLQRKKKETEEKKNLQKAVLKEAEKTMNEAKSGWIPPRPMPPVKAPLVSNAIPSTSKSNRRPTKNSFTDHQARENERLKREAEQNRIRELEQQAEIDHLCRQQEYLEDEIGNQNNNVLTDILVQLSRHPTQNPYQGSGGLADGGGASGDWTSEPLVTEQKIDESTSCQASDYDSSSSSSNDSSSNDSSSNDSSSNDSSSCSNDD